MAKGKVTGAINGIALLLSIPIIGTGIWLSGKQDNQCLNFLQWLVVAIGVLFFVVGLLGFIGAFWKVRWVVGLYLVFMFILLVLLMGLVISVFRVTHKGHGHTTPNRAYKEYNLYEFSPWLRHRVQSSSRWNHIRNCLSSSTTCSRLNQRFTFAQDFFNAPLSHLEYGCCIPPTECGYTFVNPTYWISPINQGADFDCLLWNNDQTQLCYSCNSCKAELLENLKIYWRMADIGLLVTLVALIWVYIVGCCTFRKAQTEDLKPRQRTYLVVTSKAIPDAFSSPHVLYFSNLVWGLLLLVMCRNKRFRLYEV